MSLTAAALRLLSEKGLSIDDIIDVATANEAGVVGPSETADDRRRRLDRERKAAARSAKSAKSADKADKSADNIGEGVPQMSADVRRNSADKEDENLAPTRVRDNPSRLVITGQTVVDVSAGASPGHDDWPEANIVEALVAEIASPRLDPSKSPGLPLTAGRLVAWKRDGASWAYDVLPVVRAGCARSRTPIASWKYFDAAIAQSIADNRKALTIPEARSTHERPNRDQPTARQDRLGRMLAGAAAAVDGS